MKNSPQGSIWRKWDLHLHAPGTKKNDLYKSGPGVDILDEYCKKLYLSDVNGFGITDYFSVDSYLAVVARYKANYPDSEKIFFPNIELCTNETVNKAKEEVNLHIIFDSETSETKIREFLQKLKTNKTTVGGRSIFASELKDYDEATVTRIDIKNALKETFGPEVDLNEHLLIFCSANNDGLRTETEEVGGKRRGVKRKLSITDEYDKFCDGFFGNSGSTEHFLDVNRLEEEDQKIISKPVITGSDSHSFEDLENWLGKTLMKGGDHFKESTWIKADLTFEGLKQIIYEPSERVFIGEEPDIEIRVRENQRRYISSINIDQVSGYDQRWGTWFKSESIPLNKELVAIIGNKGNGKSALTDIIGLLGNSHNQKYQRDDRHEELFSFLNKDKFLKGNCAGSFTGDLNWYAGSPDTSLLNGQTDESIPENVEYLPQKYLEKICANIEDDEFRHKLNEVIFEYIKESDKYKQPSLDELIKYLTNQTAADIGIAKSVLHDANEKVVSIERKLTPDHKKDIEEKIRLKQADIDAHKESKPKEIEKPKEGGDATVQSAEEIKIIEGQVDSLVTQINDAQAETTVLARQSEDLKQARQTIGRQVKALSDLSAKYKDLFEAEGIVFDDVVTVKATYTKIDSAVKKKEERLTVISELLRSDSDIESLNLSEEEKKKSKEKSLYLQKISLENKKKEIIDQLDKPNREYQAYLASESQWKLRQKELEGEIENPTHDTLNWLKVELHAVTKTYPEALLLARVERTNASKAVLVKKKSLVSFYEAVKVSIDEEIKKYGTDLGEYNISIEASLKFDQNFYDEFFGYVSQQAKGSFHGTKDGRAHLRKLIETVPNWQDEEAVSKSLESLTECLHSDKREGQQDDDAIRDIFKQMKQKKDPVELYDYIFGYDYLDTKYDLKVDGKDLRELSPGERGGLLLIFYLMLDRRDIPLIIDQPEDNLDNKSVYEILVTFLKKAKKRRQIIMVTHNPNLAVVADAEQIIHVSINKKEKNDFDFISGAIENPVINKLVVDILEGTLPAFDNRRLKYRKQKN